VNGQ